MERLGCIATNQNMFQERRSKRGLTCGTFFNSAARSLDFSPVGEPKILSNLYGPARLVLIVPLLLVGTWRLQEVYLNSTRSLNSNSSDLTSNEAGKCC